MFECISTQAGRGPGLGVGGSRARDGLARSRMTAGLFAGILVLSLLAAGCQSTRVRTDWDPSLSFEGFERFAFLEPAESEGADPFADNSLLRKRLRLAIENGLAARGYRAVDDPTQADFLATYSVVLDDRIRDYGSSGLGFYGNRRYGYGYGSIYSSPGITEYQESTLIIDLLDPKTEELVWRGWSSGLVGTRDRHRSDQRLNRGVQQILKRFPPDGDGS